MARLLGALHTLAAIFLTGCDTDPPLLHAVAEGDPIAVSSAIHIRGNSDVNMRDDLGRPLLIVAIQGQAEAVAKILLENGADPNSEYLGVSALLHASLGPRCSADVLSALLDAGVSPNQVPPSMGMTPLMGVASSGSEDCFNRLVDAGADPAAVDNAGNSVVYHAAIGGKISIVEKAVALGARPDSRNVQGVSPLMVGAALGSWELVVLLLRLGADPCAVDFRGRTARQIAIDNGHAVALAKLLECPSSVP